MDLALDSLLADLLLGGDAGIEGRTNADVFFHVISFMLSARLATSSIEEAGERARDSVGVDDGTIFS